MTMKPSRKLAFAAAILAACAGLASTPAVQAASPAAIGPSQITVDGLQSIRIGMRRAQIAGSIRPVGNLRSQGIPASDSEACDTYDTRDGRASVMIERGVVTSITTSNAQFRTPSGVGVGTTVQALRAAYGRQLTRQHNEYSPEFDYYLRMPSGNGLKFTIDAGRVSVITAGNRQALGYSEGCL